jgi:hypothetical protein
MMRDGKAPDREVDRKASKKEPLESRGIGNKKFIFRCARPDIFQPDLHPYPDEPHSSRAPQEPGN